MDKHKKQIILANCNMVPVEALDQALTAAHISFDELKQYNLTANKLNELQLLDDQRNGKIVLPPSIPLPPPIGNLDRANNRVATPPPIPHLRNEQAFQMDENILEKIRDQECSAEDIKNALDDKIISMIDLENIGIDKKLIQSLKFYSSASAITLFKKIEELPTMESGRTDLYMVGMPYSGKSTILASLIKYANQKGILIHDSYNPDGNKYLETLKRNLDYGVLPLRTGVASYNYIATSLKDDNNTGHPFNIVEVPGENYVNIFNQGFENSEIPQFINYIKSANKKILVFVLDALSHDKRFEDERFFSALDQSIAYSNILSIFKDAKVLENTDAVYFVVNKFDYIKNKRFQHDDRPEVDLAFDYMNSEFLGLLENCKSARDKSRNKFKIKVLPFSIGDIVYEKVVSRFAEQYPEELTKNLLEDSFVIKGGAFWKKFF